MQIHRLFEIVYILLDKNKVSARELAEQFEVSTRTIYRDVEVLSSAGIPIFMTKGKGGGISLLPDYVLNKAVLAKDEKADVLSSLQVLDAVNVKEVGSVLKKMGSFFGENNPNWLEVDFSSWHNPDKEAELFNTIKAAILTKKIICFSYSSGKGKKTTRQAEPLKLCFKGMSWYVYAYCRLRNDYRFFKLSRIRDIKVTDIDFEQIATGSIFKDKNIFQEQYISLKLKLSSEIAFRVYDEFDEYTKEEDGSFVVQTIHPMGDWLFPYIYSFGRHCEVLEPVEVRNALKEEMQKMISNYL